MKITYYLDVLKPHQPSDDMLARTLKKITGVKYVRIKVDEIDLKTTSLYVKIIGNQDILLDSIEDSLKSLNCSLHSLDRIIIDDHNWD